MVSGLPGLPSQGLWFFPSPLNEIRVYRTMVSNEGCPAAHVEIHSQINMQILTLLIPNLNSVQNQVLI